MHFLDRLVARCLVVTKHSIIRSPWYFSFTQTFDVWLHRAIYVLRM